MPIYEFVCQKCGKESEILVRSSQQDGTNCPHCGSEKLQKKLSVFAAGSGGSHDELPMCSGNPNACGRCGEN